MRWATLLALSLLAGCRAQVGFGLGIGADVQASALFHTGAEIGSFEEFGINYSGSHHSSTIYAEAPLIGHLVMNHGPMLSEFSSDNSHACLLGLPLLPLDAKSCPDDHSWPLEVGLALGILDLRLGVDPHRPLSGH